MNPVDTHTRHCDSCTKQVVDFSWMTDREIHLFAATHNGRLCGRFRRDQLDRPIRAVVASATGWRTAAAATAMLVSVGVAGQSAVPPLPPSSVDSTSEVTVLGEMVQVRNQLPFLGRVLDREGEPLVAATVLLSGTQSGTVTDLDGAFTLSVPPDGTLRIGYVGFEDVYLTPGENHPGFTAAGTDIHLFPTEETLPEIVVTGDERIMGDLVTGGMTIVTIKDVAPAPEVTPAGEPSVYPNPFTNHLRIRLPEHHGKVSNIMLLDMQGRTVHRWPDPRQLYLPLHGVKLMPGSYLLRWTDSQNTMHSEVVVKQ
jgi:hypothetical protein